MIKRILLIGGGGHCKSVLDSLLEADEYVEIGIVDIASNIGSEVMGVPVIGCDNDLPYLFNRGYNYAFVAVGSLGNALLRKELFNTINEIGYEIPAIVDPSATVSRHAELRQGVFIGKQSTVNARAIIHRGVIINSGAIVEHDCQIGAFTHVAPGVVIGGGVVVGENTHIGANATIKQQLRVGSNSIIGMGSVVLYDMQDNIMAYGNPCREAKQI